MDPGQLRKQAKELLAAWRAGEPAAVDRIRRSHPRAGQPSASLADAQFVLAREHGFASWPRLMQHLRLSPAAQALHTVDRLFQGTLTGAPPTVGEVLTRRADVLWTAYRDGHPAAAALLRRNADEAPTLDHIKAAIAREHGFRDWATVRAHRDEPVDPHFEAAVDCVVAGDLAGLRALLERRKELARARSPFGHHATLVHYVAANGVEMSRQWQSPRNAVHILRILLRYGADPDAVCDTYSGGSAQTPLCLLVSSAHPAEAGVQADLVVELCRGGAAPDGLDDDGLPLWTAITFGYRDAVEALARCGARVDNLVFAAALGDLARVRAFLDAPGTRVRMGLDPAHLLEYALIYASAHGRVEVVRLLLRHNPDLTVTEPVFGGTALGAARYHHRTEIEALLSPH